MTNQLIYILSKFKKNQFTRFNSCLFILFTFLSWNSYALEINHTYLTFKNEKNIETLRISNDSSVEKSYQVTAYSWTQSSPKKSTIPTSDLFPSPTIFTLPANQSQSVRIGLFASNTSNSVKGYRLVIQQLPSNSLSTVNVQKELKTTYAVSIPVVVFPNKAVQSSWKWQYNKNGDKVLFTNDGGTIIGFKNLTFEPSTGKPYLVKNSPQYVFPGQTVYFPIAKPKSITSVKQTIYDFKKQSTNLISLI